MADSRCEGDALYEKGFALGRATRKLAGLDQEAQP
jgi:hypothetical protein